MGNIGFDMKLYTDQLFEELGDDLNGEPIVRLCKFISFDGKNTVEVNIKNKLLRVTIDRLYKKCGRYRRVHSIRIDDIIAYQTDRILELKSVIFEAYQVIGCGLVSPVIPFTENDVTKVLDYLWEACDDGILPKKGILPWPERAKTTEKPE